MSWVRIGRVRVIGWAVGSRVARVRVVRWWVIPSWVWIVGWWVILSRVWIPGWVNDRAVCGWVLSRVPWVHVLSGWDRETAVSDSLDRWSGRLGGDASGV